MDKKIALLSMIIILALINWSVVEKEKHLAEGQIAYLQLAPIDPRSLMQGDYMALRFDMANKVSNALPKNQNITTTDGYIVTSLDQRKIASFKSLYKEQALLQNEILIRYRVRQGEVKFATNAFFFQEGHAKVYQTARYGQFRVDDSGELLLVTMYDKDLNRLIPDEKNNKNK